MKKRLLCLILVICLTATFPLSVSATEIGDSEVILTQATINRVNQEILTGRITNVNDVLNLALSQYNTMSSHAKAAADQDGAPLQIVQVLQNPTATLSDTSNDGVVAVTSLLVLDENGQFVDSSTYRQYHVYVNGGTNTYSIFATHTTYFKISSDRPEYDTDCARLYKAETVLVYGTAYTATKMVHLGVYSLDPYMVEYEYGPEQTIYSPSAGQTYTYIPFPDENVGWIPMYTLAFFQSSVRVYVGNEEIIAVYNQIRGDDLWSSFIEGW